MNPADTNKIYEMKSYDLPLHYFESLSIFHTIEHVDDPIQFLSDHKKFLKPGARVYLSTPNYAAKDRLESLETEDNQIQINGKRFAKLYSSEDLNSLNNIDNTDIGYTVTIEGIT